MGKNNSHIIAIIGSRGGVGTSIIASNLAMAFLQESRQRTLLLDLDISSAGDQYLITGVRGGQSLANLSKMRRIDPALLKPFTVEHPSGLSVAAAALAREQAEAISTPRIMEAIDHWSKEYSYIIADCGSDFNETATIILEKASLILVVTNPDILVVKRTRNVLEKLQSLLLPSELTCAVLNKYESRSGISPQIVQANLARPIIGVIPEDLSTCSIAITKGTPVLQLSPRSGISQAIINMARSIRERGLLEKGKQLQKPRLSTAQNQTTTNLGVIDGSNNKLYNRNERHSIGQLNPWIELKLRIHEQLSQTMDLKKIDVETGSDPKRKAVLREQTKRALLMLLEKESSTLIKSREERAQLIKELLDEALALGPLEDLLKDDSITEIMVNRKDQIYVERKGKIELVNTQFISDAQLLGIIERIVLPLGRRIDEKTPYCDARLPDGSRVHAIIPPLSIQGPMITIRKFARDALGIKDLIRFGSLSKEIAEFLRACILARLNIVISGGTGSGKTTLLNILTSFIPSNERILTIEDSAELQLKQPHVGRLESRPPNIEGGGAITIRDLVKNALRMRPDRIIVGECRSGEALDMLQAMNTGHDGSLTTIHSNSPKDCLSRLETLVMMAGMDLPSRAIREQISSAINIVIQISRLPDGSRKITHITELVSMERDTITTQDIFVFKQTGMSKEGVAEGKFVATGFIPQFIEQLEKRGITIPRGIFKAA